MLPIHKLLADRAYDATSLRDWLADTYRGRNLIERMFRRLNDFRRIATRYDKRADVFLSATCLAAAIPRWAN